MSTLHSVCSSYTFGEDLKRTVFGQVVATEEVLVSVILRPPKHAPSYLHSSMCKLKVVILVFSLHFSTFFIQT